MGVLTSLTSLGGGKEPMMVFIVITAEGFENDSLSMKRDGEPNMVLKTHHLG